MEMSEWAKREVEIAKEHEEKISGEENSLYGCFCYDSALKAFTKGI